MVGRIAASLKQWRKIFKEKGRQGLLGAIKSKGGGRPKNKWQNEALCQTW